MRRATRGDALVLGLLLLLAGAAVAAGRRARESLRPGSVSEVATLLDELDTPGRLPNAPLVDASGASAPLLSRIRTSRAVVAFYAPWCGPCQKELPVLRAAVGDKADLLVVVSRDEDAADTRRQLANLGLAENDFLVDSTGDLQREGRVTGLPTTFLLGRTGAVLERFVGYSPMVVGRLTSKLRPHDEGPRIPRSEQDE